MSSKCTYPNCSGRATYFMCWQNETGKHCGLVCATCDKRLGRANLMNLGMTNREAALFERYLVETEHDPNPAHWPIWFKSFTNLSPTELSMSQTIPLDTLVESLTLSPRSHNALRRYGISTVKQLLATNLFTVRNLGHKSIVEIRKALEGFSEQRSIQ